MRRSSISAVALLALLAAAPNLVYGTDPARTCAKKKLTATAKKIVGKIQCYATAAGKGVEAEPLCLIKVETKFAAAFAKADAKGGCRPGGDAASVESRVDHCIDAVTAVLGSSVQKNSCLKAKLGAAGKKAAGKIQCSATAAGKGQTADPACLEKADSAFAKTFAKRDAKGGCVTTNDAVTVEAIVDIQCVAPIIAAVPAATVTPTPIPTSTAAASRYVNNGDGTVTDHQTGLQWERKDNLDGIQNPADLHDADNIYSWAGCCDGDCSNYCQPNAAAAATCAAEADGGTEDCGLCASGTCNVDPSSQGALTTVWDWVNQLNAANFAGHTDWRLPSEGAQNAPPTGAGTDELEMILDPKQGNCAGKGGACINPIFGSTAGFPEWSATTWYNAFHFLAWYVDFYMDSYGHVQTSDKADAYSVRSVRIATTTGMAPTPIPTSTAAASRYVNNGDGTVTDHQTGLQWERKDNLDGIQNPADLHDADNVYSWAGCCDGDCSNYCQPNAAAARTCTAEADGGTQGCNLCASGTCNVDPSSQGALTTVWDWVNKLNAANFAGHTDWRLPSEGARNVPPTGTGAAALETIVDPAQGYCGGKAGACIDTIFGPTAAYYYLSATSYATFRPSRGTWTLVKWSDSITTRV